MSQVHCQPKLDSESRLARPHRRPCLRKKKKGKRRKRRGRKGREEKKGKRRGKKKERKGWCVAKVENFYIGMSSISVTLL